MKKFLVTLLLSILLCNVAVSQDRLKNQNLIFNAELGLGNPYMFAASSVVTGLINKSVLNDAFFENSFRYTTYPAKPSTAEAKTMNVFGLNARDLFNDVDAALKIGYQTYTPNSFFNCGFYVSGHYRIQQFTFGYSGNPVFDNRIQSGLVGLTALVSLGDMGSPSRVTLEAGCRYSMPLSYKSPMILDKDMLNKGLVSHFAVKIASRGMMQDVGIFADIYHFDLWRNVQGTSLKAFTIGLTWKITPQCAEVRDEVKR